MKYVSIFDHNTGKRIAFLENAYKVGYQKTRNSLWSAKFTLPYADRKNEYCKPFNWVEIYDQEDYIGLFRIIPTETTKNADTREITYQCEHVLATLVDDVMIGWHEIGNLGIYTNQVIQYILNQQTVQNWVLNSCDFRHQYLYGWENENLLSALFSVVTPFTENYMWEFNTSSWPWTLSLVNKSASKTVTRQKTYNGRSYTNTRTLIGATGEIRYLKNMLGMTKTVDASNICTRLYPFGYGEGDNQLNISKINPSGKKYIDSDTQDQYGIISKIWIDRRYQMEDSLYEAALAKLEELKKPSVFYSVDTAHISALRECDVGDIVRVIDDEDMTDVYLPIYSITKDDVTGDPASAVIVLGGQGRDAATSIADMTDKQRIEETYSQGAVTLYSQNFRDNASSDEPAEMRFYIPANVVHINQIILQGRLAAFRGYSKATKSGGQTSSTTADGGGTSVTSAAGGASTYTSTDGGGNTYTSTDGGGNTYTSTDGGGDTYTSTGGGGNTYTSSSGGGDTYTSTDGGGSTYSSSSGGGNTYTSSSGGGTTTTTGGGGSAETSSGTATGTAGITAVTNYTGFYTDYADGSSASNTTGPNTDEVANHHHTYYAPASHRHYCESHAHGYNLIQHTHKVEIGSHTHSVSISDHSHSVQIPDHSHSVQIPNHSHKVTIPNHSHTVSIPNHTHKVTIPNHTHKVSIPNHSHKVTIPNHSHKVTIKDHTHSVTIPSHTHNFSIAAHSHNIEYGIYKGTTANNAQIVVDGVTLPDAYRTFDDVDLIPYLNADSEGKVYRGWHTVQVVPNTLTRIELDLVIQLFANSRGGGQY